jgi:hypothetical protein
VDVLKLLHPGSIVRVDGEFACPVGTLLEIVQVSPQYIWGRDGKGTRHLLADSLFTDGKLSIVGPPKALWAEQPVTNEVVIACTRALLISISSFVRCFVEPDIAFPAKQAIEGEVQRLDMLVFDRKGGDR